MTYAEFKQNFLPQFLNIKTFSGKMEYAKQNLQRIGSGTGRIVYDIDGQKVLKLAKNTKGIAQNAEESSIGRDYYVANIVTEVFEAADDDSWLIAEKAKKVNENRIKQLTGIPSLTELYYYLSQFKEENKGRRSWYSVSVEVKEILDENDFAMSLKELIANYDQSAGDMSRPSSYGEVLHDGQPTIVLTDYGLSDEVYNTHYNPERKNKPQYQMYEYYNDANGNDDMLSNMGDSDGKEIRNGMWALSPYDVDDGSGVINEDFISFILNRDKYPTRALPSAPYLIDEFHNCVNNLNEYINHSGNKRKFYNNLLELQDYLIRGKFYDREPLPKEMVIDESNVLKEYVERELANSIASQVVQQYNYGTPKYIGEGGFGVAYDIDNKMVLKVTSDRSEANENMELMGKPLKYIAEPYRVFAIKPESGETKYYVIILEKLKTDSAYFKTMVDRMNFAFARIMGSNYADVVDYYVNKDKGIFDSNIDEEKIKKYMARNPKDKEFFDKILAIGEEVNKYGLESTDYINPNNLGYKPDGTLGFFDVGFGNYFFKSANQPEEITVNEDGTSKFSTADAIGNDNFPAHNNIDNSPMTDNNIPTTADTSIDEDLEYNHASDATKDKYIMTERVKSYMPGSKSVEVKKKCRLGGLGHTSVACNQGDMSNLNLKSIDENAEVTLPSTLPGYESFPILNDSETVGELSIIDRGVWGGNHYIAVDKIFIEKEFRGMGFANEAMEDLFEYADQNNIIVTLTPDNLWGANKNKLKSWYKSIGFVENKGKKKDFQTMQAMYRLPKSLMNENIEASEVYSNDDSIKTVIGKKRDIGFVEINKAIFQSLEKYRIGVIPVRMVTAYVMMAIIYHQTAKDKALRLFNIVKQHNGYLKDKTPEEAREIGQLLGYTERSIAEYIRRKYPNKVPTAPEPEDYNNIDENSQNENENSQNDKQINKDVATHGLNPVYVRTYKDNDDTVDVYTVNGDEMRDMGFIEWVDGGNHWVDADLPKSEQKYAKHIPKDKIVVDDVFVKKPIDFEGILLHERTESYIIKHFGYQYDDAHIIANKIELLFRKKAVKENIQTDEDAERLASLMYAGFKKKFKGNKKHHKFLSEDVADTYGQQKFGLELPHKGFEDKFNREEKEDVVFVSPVSDLVIIRNPKSLNDIGNDVRGIIDPEGNLYTEQRNAGIHFDMLYELNKLGLVVDEEDWDAKLPTNFVTVQRYGKTNKYCLGESNYPMYNNMTHRIGSAYWEKMPTFEQATPVYQRFLDKAKQKNPSIEFINEPINYYYGDGTEKDDIFETKNINEAEIMSLQNLPFKDEVEKLGGEIYAVGGAVRDEFLGKQSKDLDIIIRNIPEEQLVKILAKYGTVNPVGKSFAVMKFRPKNSTEVIDIALPRTEVSTGEGHKDFEITADYRLPIEKDLERRDFTINAIAKDMQGNIIDPFKGQEDLTDKVIRVTHPKSFSDDPLRMLRAVQFSSRFGFKIEPETYQMIKDNAGKIKTVAKDRVQEELSKIIEKGNPFIGAQLLQDSGLLSQMIGTNVPPFTNDENWKNVRTMAEFVYMLVHNVQSPLDFYKRNLRGDTAIINELQGLMIGMDEKNISTNLVVNRSIAHNMALVAKGNNVLQSKLLSQNLQVACQELLTGKYPITINDLAVNGNDLISLGLIGREVGDMQKSLLVKVYADKVKNDKDSLLGIAGQGNNEVKEGIADTYAEKQFNIPNVPAKMNVQAMAGMQKEAESPVGYVETPYSSKEKKVAIYLNPKSLTNFDYEVRAIVNDKGDLYVAQTGGRFNHGMMAKALGLFDNDNDLYVHGDEYQGLQRIGKTNSFGVSDSGMEYAQKNYENIENTKEILREVKRKNPQYEFYLQRYDDQLYSKSISLDEFAFPEFPEPNDTWDINGEQVGIPFFVEKYDIWNQGGYSDPSEGSVLEFLQNNYEDFVHDERLKKILLQALTDRNILDEINQDVVNQHDNE
jgi:tRNA nucleotidyltransferase/poly(A) polymerase/GNAT superfamily N-acetyltransferase